MSTTDVPSTPADESTDPWKELAEHRDTLEMMVEEDVAWAHRAEKLLERLEEEGY